MNEFIGIITQLKANNKEVVVMIGCEKRRVKISDIVGDMVTLHELNNQNRYDLHYTQIIICSLHQ